MAFRAALAVSLVFFLVDGTRAQEDSPVYLSGSGWRSTAQDQTDHGDSEKPQRLDHLQQAVEHLRAAGLNDLAAEIEEHAEREVLRRELTLKRSQLEKISKDIQRLERLLGGDHHDQTTSAGRSTRQTVPKQITTRIKVVEVDLAKLDELGFGLGKDGLSGILLDENSDQGDSGGTTLPRRKLVDASTAKLLDWLCSSEYAKVVAEPVLITTSGRPASFFSGGEVPVVTTDGDNQAINYRQVGTRIELLAVALSNGKIRLEVRPTLSRVVQATATDSAESGAAGYQSHTYKAAAELESGQTLALGGIAPEKTNEQGQPFGLLRKKYFKRKPASRRELILLVTPELVEKGKHDVHHPAHSSEAVPPRALQLFPKGLGRDEDTGN